MQTSAPSEPIRDTELLSVTKTQRSMQQHVISLLSLNFAPICLPIALRLQDILSLIGCQIAPPWRCTCYHDLWENVPGLGPETIIGSRTHGTTLGGNPNTQNQLSRFKKWSPGKYLRGLRAQGTYIQPPTKEPAAPTRSSGRVALTKAELDF